MFRDEAYRDTLQVALEAVRARILRDREQAPEGLEEAFTVVADRLLDPSLGALDVWETAGVTDRVLISVFAAYTRVTLRQYIKDRRVEVAEILMALTDLDLVTISERVGYSHYPTFSRAYRERKNEYPSDTPREKLPPAMVDDVASLMAGWGLLGEDELIQFVEDLRQIYAVLAEQVSIDTCPAPDPEPLIIFDGPRGTRWKAKGLWQEIRDLPFDEQCREVRGILFRSEVLFDLLRRESRLEGRKSRQRGIEVAKLALVSLERSDEVFGERIHDLRALGWAWVGNAYRLALDFSAAAEAFEQADREWETPRAQPDLSVLAHICCLRGVLRMMRREYAVATRDLNRSCSLFQQLGQESDEALALIHRAMILGYAGKPGKAIDDLRDARGLIDEDERELPFVIQANLANALARAGKIETAAKELDHARQLSRTVCNRLGAPELDCIAGLISEQRGDFEAARMHYQDALATYRSAKEFRYFGVVAVDQMMVCSIQDDRQSVVALAAEALPILEAQKLHQETITALRLLAQAIDTGCLSRRHVKELRVALRKDPLVS